MFSGARFKKNALEDWEFFEEELGSFDFDFRFFCTLDADRSRDRDAGIFDAVRDRDFDRVLPVVLGVVEVVFSFDFIVRGKLLCWPPRCSLRW